MPNLLIAHDEIARAVTRLAQSINEDYADTDPIILCVLNGGFMFFSDLVRQLGILHQLDFVKVSSYGDRQTADEVQWIWQARIDVTGRHVIVVDDIIDTGATAKFISAALRMKKAKSITWCVLLSKIVNRQFSIFCPYVGIDIDDHFVYGYGLDNKGRDRHLLDIYYEK